MSEVDLHIHSTFSGGDLSPAEVVSKSAELGMTVIALTDHDATDGIASAQSTAKAFPQLRFIPGIELGSEDPSGPLHILSYFIDPQDAELTATLAKSRDSQQRLARKMVTKLADSGIHLNWQRIQEIAGPKSPARIDVVKAMIEKGYAKSIMEVLTKFPRSRFSKSVGGEGRMSVVETVALIIKAKGLPVLAHPFGMPIRGTPYAAKDLEGVTRELKEAGLVGIEAYRFDHSADQIAKLVDLADKYDLIPTGGSDYHGWGLDVETMIGGAPVQIEAAERLIAVAEERGLTSNS